MWFYILFSYNTFLSNYSAIVYLWRAVRKVARVISLFEKSNCTISCQLLSNQSHNCITKLMKSCVYVFFPLYGSFAICLCFILCCVHAFLAFTVVFLYLTNGCCLPFQALLVSWSAPEHLYTIKFVILRNQMVICLLLMYCNCYHILFCCNVLLLSLILLLYFQLLIVMCKMRNPWRWWKLCIFFWIIVIQKEQSVN